MKKMKDYFDGGKSLFQNTVNCPFKDKCTSANSYKCNSCRNNKGKRDYYDPDPYRPCTPYPDTWKPEPYSPFKPIWISNRCQYKTTPRFAD